MTACWWLCPGIAAGAIIWALAIRAALPLFI